MINEGLEPKNFLNDLLEIIYFIQQKKNLGTFDSDLSISESEIEIIETISKDVSISTIVVFWQFILKGLEELFIVSNQILSLEMLVIKLIHIKDMPSYEGIIDLLNKNDHEQNEKDYHIETNQIQKNSNEKTEKTKSSKDQIKNIVQTKPQLTSLGAKNLSKDQKNENISSFEDLIQLSKKKKEIELSYDLEKNVNLVKFDNGKIDISFNENLSKQFVRNLSENLLEWTGKRWVITLTKTSGQKTFSELQALKKNEQLDKEKEGEIYKKFKNIFTDAELIEVSKKD